LEKPLRPGWHNSKVVWIWVQPILIYYYQHITDTDIFILADIQPISLKLISRVTDKDADKDMANNYIPFADTNLLVI
jgi:hypothetical protein